MAAGSQSSVGCRGLFSSTHTFVVEAAQLFVRPPDCLDACYDGCNRDIFPIFSGKIMNKLYNDILAAIAVIMYWGDHHINQG